MAYLAIIGVTGAAGAIVGMAAMTADEIKERSRYVADDGKECFEVLDWLEAIAARC